MKTIVKTTMAICIFCLFAFAQTKPKAAVYIRGYPEGRDALRMAVNNFLIKSGKYQMIAVDAIDVVAEEQNRQRSGSVSNEDIALLGRDAGAQYVCVVERAESDGRSYVTTSMVSVQSKIAELSEMSELTRGEIITDLIEKQINSMLGIKPQYRTDMTSKKTLPIWVPLTLNIAGLAIGSWGYYVERKEIKKKYESYNELKNENKAGFDDAWKKVEDAKTKRNVLYVLGGAVFSVGVLLWF